MDNTDELIQPMRELGAVPPWLYRKMDDVEMDVNRTHFGNKSNANAIFDDLFMSESDQSAGSSVSEDQISDHSYVPVQKNGRMHSRTQKKKRGPLSRDNDSDNSGMDMVDDATHAEEMTKATKKEITFDFRGEDMEMSKMMCGMNIKTTANEQKMIHDLEQGVELPEDVPMDRRFRNMMASGPLESQQPMHNIGSCRLCSHCSIRSIEEEGEFRNAYDIICNYDIEKYGYVSDTQMFIEMADLFNRQQSFIKKNGGTCFWVTAEEVRDHFVYHDMNNPMRIIGEELIYLKEVIRKGRTHLIGKANGKTFWNGAKTKLYLSTLKEYKSMYREYITYRHQINMHTLTQKMKASPKKDKAVPSRHLNGAVPAGKHSLQYIIDG